MLSSGPRHHDIAAQFGLAYQKKAPLAAASSHAHLPEIKRRGGLRHVMRGEFEKRPFIAFQHTYQIFTGQGTAPVSHTVYSVQAPLWPRLSIERRHMIGRLYLKFTSKEPMVLEEPAFIRRFKVITANEDFALTVLHPEMQRFLLSKTTVAWHIGRGLLSLVYPGPMKVKRIGQSLDRLGTFLSLLPDELDAW